MLKKKVLANDVIKGTPTRPGRNYEIQNRLNRLKDRQEPKNNNNNDLSPPPSPPFFPPLLPHYSYHLHQHHFNPYHQFLICFNHKLPEQPIIFSLHHRFLIRFNHQLPEQTKILEIFISLHSFLLSTNLALKGHQITYLALTLLC